MNQSIWERRQAVASRLEGHVQHQDTVRAELTSSLAAASLCPEDVDPHGHLSAALSTLAHVATAHPGFDLLLAVPAAGGHGLRLRSDESGAVHLEVVALNVEDAAQQAVASELASLLWQR
ncbi:hypothetical protein [Kineococcus sp. SYSU DK003]|uniref:hypothetical protein n=1 Tax=Kineococcus sp. SYSU DK003 TaxID=3383124 RepID=UPI003D7C424D